MIKLEVCANSIASALAAQQGGADRIELCDNMAEGGTTPSYATLAKTRELLHIQLYPIIRPRGGDFLYNDLEFELMLKNIALCKKIGCDGVVIGLLTVDGHIDQARTKVLVDAAYPLDVTFHRAFDHCKDPMQAIETIIETGCIRILTSGQQPTAPEGAELIEKLVKKADDRIIIMPGSGVRVNNIAALVKKTHAREYHSTAKAPIHSQMEFLSPLSKKTKDISEWEETDAAIVRELRNKAEQVQ